MRGNFILDRLKEHFGNSDEDSNDGFEDMNYIIGNSTGMDVGEFPTPLDQRIGYASMTGGSLLELQITNPATFELEGNAMIDVTSQLGVDVTTHPDMNAGFCTAEKSARGEEYGYETVEQYFTDYLQELAHFKKKVEKLGDKKPLFQIGRINPHISTSPQPGLAERMANDVGVDPFGFEIAEFGEGVWKKRNHMKQNIYQNPDFLRKFYKIFVAEELGENEYQYFGNFYTSFSNKFDYTWRKMQNKTLDHMYDSKTGEKGSETKDKIDLVSTASMRENVSTRWLEILAEDVSKFEEEIENPLTTMPLGAQNEQPIGPNPISSLEDLDKLISELSQRYRLSEMRNLPEIYYFIKSGEINRLADRRELENEVPEEFKERLRTAFEENMPNALNKLWKSEPREENEDEKVSLISVQGKLQAMVREMEIPDNRVQERTFEDNKGDLRDDIAELFAGDEKEYFEEQDDSDNLDWKKKHRRFLQAFGRNLEQEMWKESSLFYKIIPAWMTEADEDYKGHDGWDAPEFIWKTVVEDKWGGRDDVDLDLRNPRNGVYDEDEDSDVYHFLDLLEESGEFRRDVCAAVGACYAWGHFTQRSVQFDLKGRDYGLSDEEAEVVENSGWSWVDWMNRFGLGVNLETMQGSPQMPFKVWRPKDISIAAHAINLTARKKLEQRGKLGGLDHMHEDLDGCPAKFTIDMEHVATLGAPPMNEMEIFFDQEERLAEEHPELNINPEKPAAKILRQMHLMDPGVEGQRGTLHGSFERGNKQLYNYLYTFVENGFARNENEPATVLFELAEHNDESSYMMRLAMDLIELGVKPEELNPNNVTPGEEPENEKEALIARYFGMEQVNYNREWAKIEEHAFDPLQGLLEAEEFDYTYSSKAAVDQGQNRPQEWQPEEYQ